MSIFNRSLIQVACAGGTGYCFTSVLSPLLGPVYSRTIGLGIFLFTVAIMPAAPEHS
jgi:hypothetical protein